MPEPTEWEQKVDRYFDTLNPWGSISRGPSEAGSLATIDYDPTEGEQSVNLTAGVFACKVCGGAVLDWKRHIDWHEGTHP